MRSLCCTETRFVRKSCFLRIIDFLNNDIFNLKFVRGYAIAMVMSFLIWANGVLGWVHVFSNFRKILRLRAMVEIFHIVL